MARREQLKPNPFPVRSVGKVKPALEAEPPKAAPVKVAAPQHHGLSEADKVIRNKGLTSSKRKRR